jgi:hypothetical protein
MPRIWVLGSHSVQLSQPKTESWESSKNALTPKKIRSEVNVITFEHAIYYKTVV